MQCAVCLNNVTYPVETNCGHTFCCECVLAYWRADRWPRACRCPVCRREVTLLLTDQRLSRRYQELWEQVQDYNQRMSGEWRPVSYIYVYVYYISYNTMAVTMRAYNVLVERSGLECH